MAKVRRAAFVLAARLCLRLPVIRRLILAWLHKHWERATRYYERRARELGYLIDTSVLCCGVEVNIGDRCEGQVCERITHRFDPFCICTACYRIVYEVDEADGYYSEA